MLGLCNFRLVVIRFTVIRSEFVFDSEQDNVEEKQSEQEVLQAALQDTALEVKEPENPLKTREGMPL